MKSKRAYKATAVMLAAFSTLAFTGCRDKTGEESAYATLDEVEFWGAYSSEKVLKDNVTTYDDIKQDAVINVAAIGGEEEATQIIMTSGDKAVASYDLTVSDLSGDNGETFSKDNIKVYHEDYIYVGQGSEYYTESGYYPDCLIPYESVKKVNETGFEANNNQGLYVSFKIPQKQKAGTYTGTLGVTIAEETKEIPVTLRVVDGFITEETHTQSLFSNGWYFFRGELDATAEMFEAYNQKLFEYRVGASYVVWNTTDLAFFVERACEYAKQASVPCYNIPWASANWEGSGYVLNGRELYCPTSYSVDHFLTYFRALAYGGLEAEVDPFKKAVIYGWDEPDLGLGKAKAAEYTREWSYIVKQCQEMVAQELRADDTIENQELLEQIIESLLDVPHLILSSTFLDNDFDLSCENAVYGPEFQYLESQGQRDRYRLAEDNDLWWYGCVQPDYPYPTYHIDDTVLSARLESWMRADYDIQGNLYWSTCSYSEPSVNGVEMYPEDFYNGNAARCLATNGEGFVFYPGKRYGIYGPLPSIRLEHIRDGLEEYEMIYKMKQTYASVGEGYSEDAIMRFLYDSMYLGSKVSTTAENFEYNRSLLLSLFELVSSKAQVCITNVLESSGGYKFEVYTNEGYTLKQAGIEVTDKRAVEGGNLYTVELKLAQGEKLDLSVEIDGNTYSIQMNFGSGATTYDAAYAEDNGVIQTRNIQVTTEMVAATTVNPDAAADEQYMRLYLAEAPKNSKQDFLLVDDNVIKKLDETVDKFVIRLYNASTDTIESQIMIKYGKNLKSYATYANIELVPGMNVLTISNFAGFKWKDIKYIHSLRVAVGNEVDYEQGSAARDYLYFVDMTVYKK